MSGTQQFLLLCVIIAGGVFAVGGLRDGSPTKEKVATVVKKSLDETTLQGIKDYMRETVPDPDAEIVRRGPLIEHDLGYWQSVKVRGKNAFGGPIFVNWVFRFSMLGELESCRTMDDFVRHVMNTYDKAEQDRLFQTMDAANEKAAQ